MSRCFLIPKLDFDPLWLKGYLRPGDRVVAMKLAEFARLRGLLPGVTAPEEWIPYPEMKRLARRAYEINQAFAAESCEADSLEGYDWPRICINMQDFFFRDILLADALAEALKKEPWEKVVWVGNPRPEGFFVGPTTNVVASAFQACLGEGWEVMKPPSGERGELISRFRQKAQFALWMVKKKAVLRRQGFPPRGEVVAVFPPTDEWARFSDALEDLHREWGGNFQVWSVGRVPRGMQAWAKDRGARAVWLPYPDAVGKETASYFRAHWGRWSSGGGRRFAEKEGCRVLASDHLAYHFDFYFNGVWPRMAEYARVMERYLQAAKPRYIIGSTDPTSSQLFVYAVARKMGIPSIALPHGSVQMGDSLIGSSYLACRNGFERSTFLRSFPEESQIFYCRNAANELSYPAVSGTPSMGGGKKSVLILSSEAEVDQTLMPYADRVAVLESFRRLKDAPEDLRDLEFFIKCHPRWNLSAMFRELDLQTANLRVLDSGLSLLNLVEKSWAVVMFNHFGSAVLHAIRAEKPILFVNSADLYWPCTEWLSFPAGEVVEDLAGLWSHLRRLKESPPAYQELQQRCRRFKAENLAVPAATLAQAVRTLKVDTAYARPSRKSHLEKQNSHLPLQLETGGQKILSPFGRMGNFPGQAREGSEDCRRGRRG